jgi:hypothetical protein
VIYLLIYVGLLLCGFVSRGDDSLRKALYYICLLGLFFFVGFRYEVGCDWTGYLSIFNVARYRTMAQTTLQSSEAAFWAINKLLNDFELEYPYINVIASAIFFLGLHALAKRQPDPFGVLILAFPVLILNLAMSGIRQAIALGVLCLAYNAFVDRRLVRYVLFVMIAASFHTSAIAFFMLMPFVRGEFSRQRIALGILFLLPGAYLLSTSEAMDFYTRRYVGTATEAFGGPFRTGLLALSGIVFLLFLDRKWKAQSVLDYKLVKISSYMMAAAFPLSLFSSVMGDRFGYYLYPVQLMILARLPNLVKGPYTTIVAFAPYAVGVAVLATWMGLSSLFAKCYLPYQMWW